METAFAPLMDDETKLYTPQLLGQPVVSQQQQEGRVQGQIAEPAGYGILPHIISIAAAAKGNFGPAFTIAEQKRKTALYRQVIPEVARAQMMTNAGDFDKAQELLTNLIGTVGDRSPELATFIQGALDKTYQKGKSWEETKTLLDYYDKRLPEDDPRRKDLSAAQVLAKNRSKGSEMLMKTLAESLGKRDVQVTEDRKVLTAGVGGESVVTSLPTVPGKGTVSTFVLERASSNLGIAPDDMLNIWKGEPVLRQDAKGQWVNVATPEIQQKVRDAIVEASKTAQSLDLAKNVPLEPGAALQLLQQGVSAKDIALRNIGPGSQQPANAGLLQPPDPRGEVAQFQETTSQGAGYPPGIVPVTLPSGETVPMTVAEADKVKKALATGRYQGQGAPATQSGNPAADAIAGIQQRKKEELLLSLQADLDKPVTFITVGGKQMHALNIEDGTYNKRITGREAAASDKYAIFSDNEKKNVDKLLVLRNGLTRLSKYINNLSDINDPINRAAGYIESRANSMFGINAQMTGLQVAQALVNTAFENLVNPDEVQAGRYRDIKVSLTGPGANKQGAVAALQEVEGMLKDNLRIYLQSGVEQPDLPFADVTPKVEKPPGPPGSPAVQKSGPGTPGYKVPGSFK